MQASPLTLANGSARHMSGAVAQGRAGVQTAPVCWTGAAGQVIAVVASDRRVPNASS